MKILKIGSTGPLVSFLQQTLKNIGIYDATIDGILGSYTMQSVKKFQTSKNLTSDGIVGEKTWNALLEYMTVPTDIPYIYDILELNIKSLKQKYEILQTGTIGTSVMNKEIPYIKLGNGDKKVLFVAGTHANEWITCPVLMKFVEDYLISYSYGTKILTKFAKEIYDTSTIYIIPMLNPDGIDLVNNVIPKSSPYYTKAKSISKNFPNIRFPDGWKANIEGIDLNLQFPAKWDKAKEIKYSQGFTTYAPRDFVGEYPLQAIEAVSIYDFTITNSFDIMLTYHSQGEVIYWKFDNFNPPNSQKIGEEFSKISGYTLELTPYSSSYAGFKDWFIQNYNLPGYTIEVGLGTNPLPVSQFDSIYEKNIGILEIAPFLI